MSEAHKMPILRELYDFMAIPYNDGQKNYTFVTPWDTRKDSTRHPFSLTRDKNFDPNHWIEQLNAEVCATIRRSTFSNFNITLITFL